MRMRLIASVILAIITIVVSSTANGGHAPPPGLPRTALTIRFPVGQLPSRIGTAPVTKTTPERKPAVASVKPREAEPVTEHDTQQPSAGDFVRRWDALYVRDSRQSESDDQGSCPRATTCTSYALRTARWPTDQAGRVVIRYAYNDEGRRPLRTPDGITQSSLRAAMSDWMHWNSNVVFQSGGSSAATFGADGKDGTCADGTNVITWRNFSPDVIGAAVMCTDRSGRVIRDVDLALNSAHHWERINGTPESRHSYDIQSIFTHELGHWLGLEDLYSSNASRQTMSGTTRYGETRKRTPALGDVIGVQKAYPCGAADTCPRSGIVND